MKHKFRTYLRSAFFILLIPFMFSTHAFALEPEEVAVLANKKVKDSILLAKFYMEKRQIPEKNLILLSMTDKETCERKEYENKAIPPVRKFLDKNKNIRAMVIMFGLPLRISPPRNSPEGTDKTASFDSELMLVKKKNYDLNMWLPNPYYLGFKNLKTPLSRSDVIMTSRLDGADTATVKRIINDSMEAEINGLKGKAYFDARWIDPGEVEVSGYAFYDKSLHETARILSESDIIPVVLNDTPQLFQKGESPDTALYCGWYSLAQYVDAFVWQKGAVGYHIASAECTTLKKEDSQVWCKKMLDNGIAATIGPVGEPYVQAFPVPAIFFSYLTEGYLTLAESYLVSLPYLSWKMVLVGDPLYRLNLKS